MSLNKDELIEKAEGMDIDVPSDATVSDIKKLIKDRELSNKIDSLQTENEKLRAENHKIAQEASEGKYSPSVEGSFSAQVYDENKDKMVKKKYGFKDGRVNVRLSNGKMVPSEELIKIADDAEYQPSDELRAECPTLNSVTHKSAEEWLQKLAAMKSGVLREID